MSGFLVGLTLAALAGARPQDPPSTGGTAASMTVLLEGGVAVLEPFPGRDDVLLWIDRGGRVGLLDGSAGDGRLAPRVGLERWTLPRPERTLVGLGRVGGDADGFLTLSPDGAHWYRLGPDGAPSAEPERLARRARFALRTGAPRRADVLLDLNGDGSDELIVPARDRLELWTGERDAEGRLEYRRSLELEVEAAVSTRVDDEDLSQRLVGRIDIPGLWTEDLNGDGLADLVARSEGRNAFHMARPDGSLPAEPDVSVDLSLFRDDSSADAVVAPGATVTLGAGASLTRRDLDGDGIADHAIAAGRKVWVFRGTPEGPQFTEPSAILKSGDDVTKAAIVELDADGRPDLLLVRLQAPNVATLVLGLVREFDIVLSADGYRNVGEGRFETRPAWTSEVRFRLPPILDLVGDPSQVLEDLQAAGERYRILAEGDLDGDGTEDVAAVTEAGDAVEVWFGGDADAAQLSRDQIDALVAEALFGEGSRVWTLERVFAFLGAQGGDAVARATGGRSADRRLALDPEAGRVERMLALDPDGDGRDALVLVRALGAGGTSVETLAVAR